MYKCNPISRKPKIRWEDDNVHDLKVMKVNNWIGYVLFRIAGHGRIMYLGKLKHSIKLC